VRVSALVAAVAAVATVAGVAHGQLSPLNDLFAVGQGGGESPASAPVAHRAEPPFVATPLVPCGAGSHPQPGVDGRVPAGSAKDGLSCNVALVGHQGTEGGFKVYRYIDTRGHECAFYDTTLMFPLNALNPGGGSQGVAVLDMSNPSHPVQTATLSTTPMLSPHESLNLNGTRGLLAAVNGNLATEPGFVSIYDAHADCRHPVLQSNGPFARFGHESGFSRDGKTFYATSTALQSITAIDVTDPKAPHAVWQGNVFSHGMTLSDNGNRAYVADPKGNMLILDTSQIQSRKANPKTREISRLTWNSASIPQNAIPFTEHGHPYVLEFDEYDQSTLNPNGNPNIVGAARIIDISDETKPFIVSNLRLQVDQPAEHAAASGDPGGNGAPQGYAAHYCNIPTRVDPKVVACSFIASGLRIFNIADLVHPKEIGYFVAPPQPRSENGYRASDFAMSKPAFAPERREIWFTDGTSGFYALRVDKSVWPQDAAAPSGRAPSCTGRRRVLVKAQLPRGARVRSARATLAGRPVPIVRRRHGLYAVVDLRYVPRGTKRLAIRLRLANGRTATTRRTYSLCSKPLRRPAPRRTAKRR
jgi:LVIVD repeat-containing protein